ncbi:MULTISPECIES: endonuclease/exonuclease/phosphatase family protein [Sphingobium]|uniref:Endonuclease n=1 Tax=Sphingobium chungbukense TaxID=56193 RepID=A0A0M3ANQ6_9SPHN|nr:MULTISPECIES: endonuclease/exonuclease/phosphatase family protein [Sphingobium]KKW91475.1 endonuclease [Sphingobium chungbukense]PJG46335.1 endonuclease [Sphingobium sp. LB126]
MFKTFFALLFALLAALAPIGTGRMGLKDQAGAAETATGVPGDNVLSVMTYNIKGLPWPVALDRAGALDRIGQRLAAMRRAAQQPHIVLMQEVFSSQAAEVAAMAGYRHVIMGPDTALRTATTMDDADRHYIEDGRWDRGENMGKPLNSGLMILSDYPVLGIDRMAFPDFACAGFDCLANKGVLIAHLDVPGIGRVSIINAHLNARSAAMVPVARSQQAFVRQVDLMARFVVRHVPRGQAMILGGDMNIGGDLQRRTSFFTGFKRSGFSFVTPALDGASQALAQSLAGKGDMQRDLLHAARHGKDWLFARDTSGAAMSVASALVPFGNEVGGEPLSDHFGYVIDYAPQGRHERIHLAERGGTRQPGAL